MSSDATDNTMRAALLPCPFCGAGETAIHVNQGTWTGMRYGEPVSVEVRHWCSQEPGQPSRGLVRVGRDEAAAIAAWNRRAAPVAVEQVDAAHGPMTKAPEVGSEYWVLVGERVVSGPWSWDDDDHDRDCLEHGECFRTEADARAALAQQKGGAA
jgi:hypothetical protein